MKYPSLEEIGAAAQSIQGRVRKTPVWQWPEEKLASRFGIDATIFVKLEMLQYTGSFKPRGALLNALELNADQLERGITAVSAGNHAAAVGYAASQLGAS